LFSHSIFPGPWTFSIRGTQHRPIGKNPKHQTYDTPPAGERHPRILNGETSPATIFPPKANGLRESSTAQPCLRSTAVFTGFLNVQGGAGHVPPSRTYPITTKWASSFRGVGGGASCRGVGRGPATGLIRTRPAFWALTPFFYGLPPVHGVPTTNPSFTTNPIEPNCPSPFPGGAGTYPFEIRSGGRRWPQQLGEVTMTTIVHGRWRI